MKYTLYFYVCEQALCPGNNLKIQSIDFTLRSFAGFYTNVPLLPILQLVLYLRRLSRAGKIEAFWVEHAVKQTFQYS